MCSYIKYFYFLGRPIKTPKSSITSKPRKIPNKSNQELKKNSVENTNERDCNALLTKYSDDSSSLQNHNNPSPAESNPQKRGKFFFYY